MQGVSSNVLSNTVLKQGKETGICLQNQKIYSICKCYTSVTLFTEIINTVYLPVNLHWESSLGHTPL